MKPSDRPLLSADQIRSRVLEMAEELSVAYAGKAPLFIVVLKGALYFASDLLRAMTIPVKVDFVRCKSYEGDKPVGTVEILLLPTETMGDRDLIVVEDVLDTGRTTVALLERLRQEGPASLALATLLDKPGNRIAPIQADYIGFTLGTEFIVGYGLDYDERYRELPDIRILEDE